MTFLNLGCGEKPLHAWDPWVNVDSWPGCEPDVCCDVLELPFEDGSAEAVYCGHILEHLTYEDELPRFLREVKRVLGEFGQLCVVGPDYNRATTNPAWFEMIPQIMHGDEEHPGNQHRWISTAWKNLLAVREIFPAAHEIDIRAVSSFWPVFDNVGWQFAILTEV